MTQLIFLIAFICAEKRKFTQTLNVDINSSTTENAHAGTTKYLMLCVDLKYKQWTVAVADRADRQSMGHLKAYLMTWCLNPVC